jgi:pimeloyl-[acyl-carrier protein] synthase
MIASPSHDPLRGLNSANRYEVYAGLRERLPIYWSSVHPAWIVTRYVDVNTVLRRPDAVPVDPSKHLLPLARRGGIDLSSLLRFCDSLVFFAQPPRHDAIRRVMAQTLAGIRSLDVPQLLGGNADRLLDAGQRAGTIDLAGGYGKVLPLIVGATFLGIPQEHISQLSGLADDLIGIFEFSVPSISILKKLNRCAGELADYFSSMIIARRRIPADDGASLIIRLADEQLHCDDEELAYYCLNFFLAAEATTGAAISSAALTLLQNPSLSAQLRADPALFPVAVSEFMRLATPVQFVARQLPVDIELAGQLIPAGDPVMLILGSVNRDPAAFPNPNEPLLDRSEPKPLSFAAGPYSCIGIQLATLEVEVAMRRLLERPSLRLASEPAVWSPRRNFAPLERVPACFG